MTYSYRCTNRKKCGLRVTLKKHKEFYIKTPTCKSCGGNINFDPAVRRKTLKQLCTCDCMPGGWPHRQGSSVWCFHHPTGPTEEDWEERYMNCSYE